MGRFMRVAAAVLLTAAVAGCSSGGTPPSSADRSASDPNFLAGCGPVTDQVLARSLQGTVVRQQTAPTVCTWRAQTAHGVVDVTYSWFQDDVLMRDTQVAAQYGYQIEKLVVKKFGGMYWRDPNDPGSCGITTADTGTITWWTQNRDHAAQPDPCAVAMSLMQHTLLIDGT
ncbi:hypothetical protein ABIA39_008009 [Nocardia sp. GAS34]|uniref:DUF3558 family protein n=1 Tax=unclassified Nocardia TaxID=2637762 RepID=UPI003D1D0BEB